MEGLRQNTQVSIIIPIYNAEKYLRRCLDSILKQTHTCLEIVLIDDGSTDASKNICEDYCNRDCRFRYVYQENQGAAVARNNGIDHAMSEYLTFLDADDSIEPMFVEHILTEMLATDSDMGICDINYVNSVTADKQVSKIRFSGRTASANNTNNIFNTVRTFIWGKIYKSKLFANIRFPDLNFFEDLATVPFIAAIASQIVHVPLPLINYYRHHVGSLSENSCNTGDLVAALELLGERLRAANLYDNFADEYKKMFMGQLRFLYRRFGSMQQEESLDNLIRVKEYVLNVFPSLYPLTVHKFYIESTDTLLIHAADKAVLFNDQIIDNIDSADYSIYFNDSIASDFTKPCIKVKRPNATDEESAAYDIAEDIIMTF